VEKASEGLNMVAFMKVLTGDKMTNDIKTHNFVLILFDKYGNKYVVSRDSCGPMSSGSDEWSVVHPNANSIGPMLTAAEAETKAVDPNFGFGKAPMPSKRVIYQIILRPVAEYDGDPEKIKNEAKRKYKEALSKLTSEEIQLLGLKVED
jgi:hypothetical protein